MNPPILLNESAMGRSAPPSPFEVSRGVTVNHFEMKIPTLTCCERDPGDAFSCVFLNGSLGDVGRTDGPGRLLVFFWQFEAVNLPVTLKVRLWQ